jgi:hypothetical protein
MMVSSDDERRGSPFGCDARCSILVNQTEKFLSLQRIASEAAEHPAGDLKSRIILQFSHLEGGFGFGLRHFVSPMPFNLQITNIPGR